MNSWRRSIINALTCFTALLPSVGFAQPGAGAVATQKALQIQKETLEKEADELSASCDRFRESVKSSFEQSVIRPVSEEMNRILSRLSPQELATLNRTIQLISSGSPAERKEALHTAKFILDRLVPTAPSALRSELKVNAPDSPLAPPPWFRIANSQMTWMGDTFRVVISFHGDAADLNYRLKLAVHPAKEPFKDVPQTAPIQPSLLEKAVPYRCQSFPTKLELSKFYTVQLQLPEALSDGLGYLNPIQVISGLNQGRNPAGALDRFVSNQQSKPGTTRSYPAGAQQSAAVPLLNSALPGI